MVIGFQAMKSGILVLDVLQDAKVTAAWVGWELDSECFIAALCSSAANASNTGSQVEKIPGIT